MKESISEKTSSSGCLSTTIKIKSNRIVATLTGIQVMRALWQIWNAIDNSRPATINDVIMPTVYISCILAIMLMITSVTATWSVYRLRVDTLNVCWWVYYMLTIFSFLNRCTNLSILCLGKDDFIYGCITENMNVHREGGCGSNNEFATESIIGSTLNGCEHTPASPSFYDCRQLWEDSVIWSAIAAMLDLLINLCFAYALYRCRVQYHAELRNMTENHIHPGGAPPPYIHENSECSGSDEFQTIELNK